MSQPPTETRRRYLVQLTIWPIYSYVLHDSACDLAVMWWGPWTKPLGKASSAGHNKLTGSLWLMKPYGGNGCKRELRRRWRTPGFPTRNRTRRTMR
jgi:hypothetical protein